MWRVASASDALDPSADPPSIIKAMCPLCAQSSPVTPGVTLPSRLLTTLEAEDVELPDRTSYIFQASSQHEVADERGRSTEETPHAYHPFGSHPSLVATHSPHSDGRLAHMGLPTPGQS